MFETLLKRLRHEPEFPEAWYVKSAGDDPLSVLDQHQWAQNISRCTCDYPAQDMAAHQYNMLIASGWDFKRILNKEDIDD